ncbi:pectate lyase family protein [Fulvivirga ligni]|uniref:pectate lyase family protein n=1 Tax=Fulvivirga ligni TaxID=2904246 RepID=UPI001F3D73D2|nr:T9SS type A sorting domain-containing protein [Fulvivirga ligni]UII23422.1 T9SS type A sorting domain-containing protein [Fulvivirga ligni]
MNATNKKSWLATVLLAMLFFPGFASVEKAKHSTETNDLLFATTRIEDSDAGTVSYDGSLKSYSAASNGKAINLSNDQGKQIVWSYNASSSGSHTLTVRYTRKSSMNPSVSIIVNGSSQTLNLPVTSSSSFATASLSASLSSGSNQIILRTNAGNESADIDWIEISDGGSGGGGGGGCTPTSITPYLQVNGGSWQQGSSVTINAGSSVKFGPQPTSGGSWSWSGCGTSGSSREQTVSPSSSCTATATYTNSQGCTSTQSFTVTVNGNNGGGGGGNGGDANYDIIGWATQAGGTSGGQGGVTVTCSTGDCILNAIDQKKDGVITQPLIIFVNGTITSSNTSASKIDVKEVRDVSIIGVGSRGIFNGIGIKIYKAGNIIIQNVAVHHVNIGDKDAISIEGPADHIWVDHCELYAEYQGVGKDYYDGLLDAKKNSEYITYSYNYLHDSWKTMLVGSSDSDNYDRKITAHHNYFDNCNSRMPLFRFGNGHFFNNYYSGVASTGLNSRMGACLRVENNYFKNSQNPIVSAYSDDPGGVDESGSIFDNVTWALSGDVEEPYDCNAYIPYSYSSSLNSTSQVPSVVVANVGIGKISGSSRKASSVNDAVLESEFSAYPNPVLNQITVTIPEYKGDEQIRIVNIIGVEVMNVKATSAQPTLDISDFKPGSYIMQVKTEGHTYLRMIVKE